MTPISFFEWFLMLIIYMFLPTSYYIALHYSLLFSYLLTRRSFRLILLFGKETRVIQNNCNFWLLLGNELLKWVGFFSLSCLFFLSYAGRWALGLVAPPAVNPDLRHGQAWRFSTAFYQQAESCRLISFPPLICFHSRWKGVNSYSSRLLTQANN